MSDLLLQQLAGIQKSVELLKQRLQDEQANVQQLRQMVADLQKELARQKNAGAALEETNKISKLAQAMPLSSAEVANHKKLISQYIREIDTCIRLLSD